MIRLEGADNCRDFSEYVNKDGRKVKPGLFIRSNALYQISRNDIRQLMERYKLSAVIDLRSSGEIREKPDIRMQGVREYRISLLDESKAGISHDKSSEENLLDLVPDMCELYSEIAESDYAAQGFGEIFEIICELPKEG